MNKRDLVEHVSERLGTTKAASEEIVVTVLQAIQDGLVHDGMVSLAGFGTWEVRNRAARTGRNPQTGETMHIRASRTVAFRPARTWRDRLNP